MAHERLPGLSWDMSRDLGTPVDMYNTGFNTPKPSTMGSNTPTHTENERLECCMGSSLESPFRP
ncbi:hypothetical protein CRG98_024870 [Punica granatum]|uniref:Uncharacterized protein n=1 Tax=Punica granatum TaxID=22663 RepID=A0A2I0JEV9_PUNGR|nr:hypothetical protein CRG98_024870 [Punica granatum]